MRGYGQFSLGDVKRIFLYTKGKYMGGGEYIGKKERKKEEKKKKYCNKN